MHLHPSRLTATIGLMAACALTVTTLAQQSKGSKIWIDRYAEFEEYLLNAPIERTEDVGVGVTKPKRVFFPAGGLAESALLRDLPPGRHRGFIDSYKADIAAYELDKLLDMQMVPPSIERRVKGNLSLIMLWVSPSRVYGDMQNEVSKAPNPAYWDRQIIKLKMFDNLIANWDRNAGNFLIDPDWNVILIDHSRAFVSDANLKIPMTRVDAELWGKMEALTIEALTEHLGKWVGKKELGAILKRRDSMKKEIDKLVAQRGEAAVFVR